MYNSLYYMSKHSFPMDKYHEILDRECNYLYPKAREMIKQLEQERIDKNIPKTRDPYLVSSRMKELPKPGIEWYLVFPCYMLVFIYYFNPLFIFNF